MTPENPSYLGYIFIIGAIALAILAYAIYLNLREDKSKMESKGKSEKLEAGMENSRSQEIPLPAESILIETPFSPVVESNHAPKEETAAEFQKKILETASSGVDMPQEQELVSVVTILREIDSGKIILRIGETDYKSLDELKHSPHFSRIMRLSTDLDHWLKPAQGFWSRAEKVVSQSKGIEMEPFSPKSMVDEINEILERRLREEPGKRKAIKLVEMLDGGVNVLIGVDSYPIDEVPFEDVRNIIREAVSEWEQRR